jgi:hypothetical protein
MQAANLLDRAGDASFVCNIERERLGRAALITDFGNCPGRSGLIQVGANRDCSRGSQTVGCGSSDTRRRTSHQRDPAVQSKQRIEILHICHSIRLLHAS